MYSRSKALESLDIRMEDIQLLLDAHKHATQRAQVDKALAEATGFEATLEALRAIVSAPGRGRPPALGALNRAAIVLLCAHLQGYFEDAYDEAAQFLLGSKVKDLEVLKKSGKLGFGNPHWEKVDALFASLGLPDMTAAIEWRNFKNSQVKERLREYIQLRNQIAHGERVKVWKPHVTTMMSFVNHLASAFDERLYEVMTEVIGQDPR